MASYKSKLFSAEKQLAHMQALVEALGAENNSLRVRVNTLEVENAKLETGMSTLESGLSGIGYVKGSHEATLIKERMKRLEAKTLRLSQAFSVFGYKLKDDNEELVVRQLLAMHHHLGRVAHTAQALWEQLAVIGTTITRNSSIVPTLEVPREVPDSPTKLDEFERTSELMSSNAIKGLSNMVDELSELHKAVDHLSAASGRAEEVFESHSILVTGGKSIKTRVAQLMKR